MTCDILINSLFYYNNIFISTIMFHQHKPVGINTNVVNQRTVFQRGLHLSQGDVLSCLQLHQVLLTIWNAAQGAQRS